MVATPFGHTTTAGLLKHLTLRRLPLCTACTSGWLAIQPACESWQKITISTCKGAVICPNGPLWQCLYCSMSCQPEETQIVQPCTVWFDPRHVHAQHSQLNTLPAPMALKGCLYKNFCQHQDRLLSDKLTLVTAKAAFVWWAAAKNSRDTI